MKDIIFSPSFLSADFTKIDRELADIDNAGAKWLHLDVMDGIFVPNITFGPPVVKAMRSKSRLFFDVHLMIHEPIRYINDFADAGANMITFHIEATKDVFSTIELIKKRHCAVGLAFNPATDLSELQQYLPDLDMVLLMSVNPGFGGQSFIDISDKIRELVEMTDKCGKEIFIQVDGGINMDTIAKVTKSGANVIVAGSAIFGKSDRAKAIRDLENAIDI